MNRHEIRVIVGDTDQMGIVYYANYLRYFESARAAHWRALGRTNRDLLDWGIVFPVVEAHCRYRTPAHYEDLLEVVTVVEDVKAASLRFAYRVERAGTLVCDGFTRHACVGENGKPRRFPDEFLKVLANA